MRPHVLYVTPIFGYPAFGGPRLRTYNTLRALARCADVSLYLTQQPDTADRVATRTHLLTFCRNVVFPEPETTAGSGVVRRALRAVLPSPVRAAVRGLRPGRSTASDEPAERDPALIDGVREWIEANQPDLIWLGFGGISYDLVPLKEHTGKPLVLETECVWSRFVLRELPFEADAARRQRIERLGHAKEAEERSGAPLVDITTAASEVDAAYFRSLVSDPQGVMLVANVIDVDAYQTDSAAGVDPCQTDSAVGVAHSAAGVRLEQPALLFAGTLSRGTANVDALGWLVDEVMPAVWRRRPDVHVYVVGRSPAPAILARRGPRVHVTGEVPSIVPYMRASVAALVPLRWESGTRFKILEAFACKTPVVSTTLGAEGLDVQHGQHLLLADAPDAFAAAVLSLVEDATLGPRLAGPAFDLVSRNYNLSTAEQQINTVLAHLGFTHDESGNRGDTESADRVIGGPVESRDPSPLSSFLGRRGGLGG
jgi:glycosyltransferase involved in cell wall biosynthesis